MPLVVRIVELVDLSVARNGQGKSRVFAKYYDIDNCDYLIQKISITHLVLPFIALLTIDTLARLLHS